jgi:hypothetical protein
LPVLAHRGSSNKKNIKLKRAVQSCSGEILELK